MSSNSADSIPTELYSLVFQFLKDAGLSRTAKSFKKEINRSIKVVNQQYGLVEVFKSYNSSVTGKNKEKLCSDDYSSSSSSENSSNNEENESSNESSSSSSSSSSSEDNDQTSEDEVSMKETNLKNESGKIDESSNEEVGSDEMKASSSSSSEDDDDASSIEEKTSLSPGKESNSSDLNSSDSSSSDSSSEQSENEEQNVEVSSVSEDSDSSNESSSESSSSNSLSEDDVGNDKIEICSDISPSSEKSDKKQEKVSNVAVQDNNSDNNSSDSESEESNSESEDSSSESEESDSESKLDNNGKIASSEIDKLESSNKNSSPFKINGTPLTNGKKLKHKLDTLDNKDCTRPSKRLNSNDSSVSTTHVTTSVHFKPPSVYRNQKKNKSNKMENKSNGNGNIYNRRIIPEKVEFLDERLKDNSFLAKDGAIDSYGYKAHNDLSVTRGKDFRAQKTKKKRGSYRGGKIDLESHSIKFAVDD